MSGTWKITVVEVADLNETKEPIILHKDSFPSDCAWKNGDTKEELEMWIARKKKLDAVKGIYNVFYYELTDGTWQVQFDIDYNGYN